MSRKSAQPLLSSGSEESEPGTSFCFSANKEEGLGSSESAVEPETQALDFSLIPSLVELVKDAMKWREEASPPRKQPKYYLDLKKSIPSFPLIFEIQEIVEDELAKPDKRLNVHNRVLKLFPFRIKDAELWDSTPKLDASLQRLARHITLPLVDSVSFKDPMDRRIFTDLKRMYTVVGVACRLAIALTSVAVALRVCVVELEAGSSGEVIGSGSYPPLQSIRTAVDFLAEAAMDQVRMTAKLLDNSVTARRIKHWSENNASKHSLCSVPLDGKLLLGKTLESAIQRVSGSKSGLTPQERIRLISERSGWMRYKTSGSWTSFKECIVYSSKGDHLNLISWIRGSQFIQRRDNVC